jgi:hypothetical protein
MRHADQTVATGAAVYFLLPPVPTMIRTARNFSRAKKPAIIFSVKPIGSWQTPGTSQDTLSKLCPVPALVCLVEQGRDLENGFSLSGSQVFDMARADRQPYTIPASAQPADRGR